MSKNKGFTLVELLVVISIISVLSVIGITSYSSVQSKARDTKRKADIDAIAKAFAIKYNAETGQYSSITGADFASGTIPTQPDGSPYPGCSETECSVTTGAITSDGREFSVSISQGGSIYTRASSPLFCSSLSSLRDDLVGYWDFNEGTGDTVADKSGSGYTGTWTTDGARWVDGKIGKAGQFIGSNSVSVNSPGLQLPQGTICLWVKPTTDWSEDTTIQNMLGASNARGWWLFNLGYSMWGLEQVMTFRITLSESSENVCKPLCEYNCSDCDCSECGSGEIYLGRVPSFNDQNWHQVCGSWDITTMSGNLYIDTIGENNGWRNYGNTGIPQMNSFGIGSEVKGLIDEVRIYDRVLSPDEITASYNDNAGCSLYY